VRAGSIVPIGSDVESTQEAQTIASLRVYPGKNASFSLYHDDGKTYAYEKGGGSITTLTWDGAALQLTHEGDAASSELDEATVVVIGK
jgi:alpha-glucosidase (family GH31 glycosyl hydrolase)